MSTYVRVRPGVDVENLEGETVAYDGEQVYLFTGSAATIWEAIPSTGPPRDVVTLLTQRFDGAKNVATDVEGFVDDLVQRKLVELFPAPDLPYHVPNHVGWVLDEDTVVLGDLRDGTTTALSQTASAVWLLLVQGTSRPELLPALESEFDGTPVDLADAVEELLTSLVDLELLERDA